MVNYRLPRYDQSQRRLSCNYRIVPSLKNMSFHVGKPCYQITRPLQIRACRIVDQLSCRVSIAGVGDA